MDKSIHNFLQIYQENINLNKLQTKFMDTQKDKIYMCYCNNNFVKDKIEQNELTLLGINRLKAGRNILVNLLK